jgi:regulator of replication initiation timing
MSTRDPMTELAVTMESLIDSVKQLSSKLDKLQDEKVQSLAMEQGRMDERLKACETTVKTAKEEAEKIPTLAERVGKLERVVYGLLYLIAAQLIAGVIGGAVWLLKR